MSVGPMISSGSPARPRGARLTVFSAELSILPELSGVWPDISEGKTPGQMVLTRIPKGCSFPASILPKCTAARQLRRLVFVP